jgi:chemotaxis protein histidine kinase CheA
MAPPADERLIEEFAAEAREHLGAIESDLLSLEARDGSCDADAIHRICRALHSIKKGAGLLGLGRINGLSHAMEALILRCRDGRLSPAPIMIDTLLAGIDGLQAMLADIRSSDQFPCEDLIDILQSFLDAEPPPDQAEAPKALPLFAPISENEDDDGPGPTGKPSSAAAPPPAAREQPRPADAREADTVRVRVDLLDSMMNLANELVLTRDRLLHVLENETPRLDGLRQALQKLNQVTGSLQEQIRQAGMQSAGKVSDKIPVPEAEDRQVLLFTFHPEQVFAMALADIAGFEPVALSAIQQIGDREFLDYRGAALPLIRLDQYLPVRPLPEDRKEGFLIVPKGGEAGLLASEILDTESADGPSDRENCSGACMAGTGVVNGRVAIFLDPEELLAATRDDGDLAWEAYCDE